MTDNGVTNSFQVSADGRTAEFKVRLTRFMLEELMEKDPQLKLRVGEGLDYEARARAAAQGYEIIEVLGIREWLETGKMVQVLLVKYSIRRIPDRAALN